MKKTLFILSALLFASLLTLPALADQRGQGRGQHHSYQQRNETGQRHMNRNREREQGYEYRRPEHRPPGYRREVHGRPGHPAHFRGHAYAYDGHWNSYNDWEKYRRRHPDKFRQGGYYRENGHLFFRFCNPPGACFFFSIGR